MHLPLKKEIHPVTLAAALTGRIHSMSDRPFSLVTVSMKGNISFPANKFNLSRLNHIAVEGFNQLTIRTKGNGFGGREATSRERTSLGRSGRRTQLIYDYCISECMATGYREEPVFIV